MTKPPNDHGIEYEPHLSGRPMQPDPSERAAQAALQRSARTAATREEEEARHAVFNELEIFPKSFKAVGLIDFDWHCEECGFNLRGLEVGRPCPECGHIQTDAPAPMDKPSYASWLSRKMAATSNVRSWTLVWLVALVGGPWAVLGAMISSYGPLGIVVFGPLAEEVMKIALVAALVEVRPYLFKSHSQIRVVAIASALAFAIIENLLYLNVYVGDPSLILFAWRWIVCTALHVGCTTVAIIGVVKVWQKATRTLKQPEFAPALRTITIAAVLHGAYNFFALLLHLSGFDF